MIRPLILNVKLRFALPPLLDSRRGFEAHKDLELVDVRLASLLAGGIHVY